MNTHLPTYPPTHLNTHLSYCLRPSGSKKILGLLNYLNVLYIPAPPSCEHIHVFDVHGVTMCREMKIVNSGVPQGVQP